MNNYIAFPLTFYMTQQLAQNIKGDFMMKTQLLLGQNVVREVLCCFLLPHVLSLESVCSSRKLMASVY